MKLVGRHGSSPPGLLVLPARLCGAAAGNRSHRYIGKVCCLLLVRAEYMGRAPGRGPEGTGNCTLRVTARFKLCVSGRAKAGWPGQLGCSRRSHGPMRCWVWPPRARRAVANFLFPGLSGNILSSFGPNGRLFGTNFAGTGSVGVYPFSRKKPGNISFKIC